MSALKPTVINLHHNPELSQDPQTLYIGRKKGLIREHFGNPFALTPNLKGEQAQKNRQACIQAFDLWLEGKAYREVEPERRQWIIKNLWRIKKAKHLACYCAPKACHGDVLLKVALELPPASEF